MAKEVQCAVILNPVAAYFVGCYSMRGKRDQVPV